MTIPEIELMLRDAVDRGGLPPDDQRTFAAIADILGSTRRSRSVTLHQRSIIVLEAQRGSMKNGRSRRASREGTTESGSRGRSTPGGQRQ
jgi:hypothetical protein